MATSVRARARVTPSATRSSGASAAIRAAVGNSERVTVAAVAPRQRLAKRARDPPEHRARRAHRDLLADHARSGQLEAVERAGNAQPGTAPPQAVRAPPRRPADRRRGRTRASPATAPRVPRGRATATPIRGARPCAARAGPRCDPTCSVPRCGIATVRAYASSVTVSTPSIARLRRNASIASQSYGGRYASSNASDGRQRVAGPRPRAAVPATSGSAP